MKNMLRSMDSETTFSGMESALNRRDALKTGGQFLAGSALVAGGFASGGAFAQDTTETNSNLVLEETVLGAADAPVTIIEYASMTCPHCARFHINTYPELKRKYIDTGKVRFIYRDFPLDGLALRGAMLARCGGENRREGFLTVLFQQQRQWTSDISSLEDLNKKLGRIAKLGGIGEDEFMACMTNPQLEDAVLKDRISGEKEFKVNSTPTFIINGEKHDGALTIEMFDDALKPLLPEG